MAIKSDIGKFGQRLAAQFLLKRGYKILAENHYCREGEIDIIAQDDKQLVFCEVKTRQSRNCGLPEEAIDRSKENKLYQAGQDYLAKNNINHDNWRIDCLAVEIRKTEGKAFIRHHKNIV